MTNFLLISLLISLVLIMNILEQSQTKEELGLFRTSLILILVIFFFSLIIYVILLYFGEGFLFPWLREVLSIS